MSIPITPTQQDAILARVGIDLRGRSSVPVTWASAGIVDARAFRVGESEIVHAPKIARPNQVVGFCGVTATVTERDSRLASWADSHITCETCKAKGGNY